MSAEYWIWLQQVLGYSSCTVQNVISQYRTAKAFHDADDGEKIAKCRLSRSQIARLHKIPRKTVYEIVNECAKTGINIITPEDDAYPERLLNIADPPAVLYVKGTWFDFKDTPAIAVVGPRKISEYGNKCAYVISNTLASCGFVIVSGGAVGGDSAAHIGAIDEGKPTVAVLGCGINSDYLKSNADLRRRIMSNGCLISEFPPSFGASKTTFPQRNRIMSGLSNGVVVIEGGIKSGTLITAKHASEQGRDVFVVPGSPSEPQYEGSNRLISDGARPLLNINDIISDYYPLYSGKLSLPKREPRLPGKSEYAGSLRDEKQSKSEPSAVMKPVSKPDCSQLSEKALAVLKKAELCGEIFIPDDLVENSGMDSGDILGSLTELEIFGFVESVHGGRYRLKYSK